MLHAFLDTEDIARCDSLRDVMCSGEALPIEVKNRFLSRSQSRLHNLYGPTEAAVDVCAFQCLPGSEQTSVPIRAADIEHPALCVWADLARLFRLGLRGALHRRRRFGAGYVGRADLTAERFVPNPFGTASGCPDRATRALSDGRQSRVLDGSIVK